MTRPAPKRATTRRDSSKADTPTLDKRQAAVDKTVANFDRLPNSALVTVPAYAAIDGISASTAWRRIRAGVVIAVRIGGTTRVPVGSIRESRAA